MIDCAALRAVALPHAGVEHAQEIVDLGDRADGRPRVVAGGFLRDRDRRRQAADVVDVGLGHLPQKLPGERAQAFDVPPLPLGVQRVERQRALAAAGDAGEANELIAGQPHVDAPQVVLAGAFDDDVGSGHAAERLEAGQAVGRSGSIAGRASRVVRDPGGSRLGRQRRESCILRLRGQNPTPKNFGDRTNPQEGNDDAIARQFAFLRVFC